MIRSASHRAADYSHGVLIADTVSDPFVRQFALTASRVGFRLETMTYAQAATHFTICTDSGAAQVLPCQPIFMRAPHYAQVRTSFDCEFLASEAIHAVWAAAALTAAPVINRPGLHALVGRLGSTRSCVEHQAGLSPDAGWDGHRCAGPPLAPLHDETDRQQEWATGLEGAESQAGPHWCERIDVEPAVDSLASMGEGRLLRVRPAAAAPGCSLCICVGESVWCVPCRGHDPDELKTRTLAAMKRLGLDFGAVLWSRGTDGSPWPACITPEPCLDWLEFAWDEIATTLLERLRWASLP